MLEILLGVVGGILVGATGSGFGTVITPVLLLLGYRPSVAIGTMLGVLVATKFVGAVTHQPVSYTHLDVYKRQVLVRRAK